MEYTLSIFGKGTELLVRYLQIFEKQLFDTPNNSYGKIITKFTVTRIRKEGSNLTYKSNYATDIAAMLNSKEIFHMYVYKPEYDDIKRVYLYLKEA